MRILCVFPGILYNDKYPFEQAGGEWQTFQVLRELAGRNHDVFITGRFEGRKRFEDKVTDGVHLVNVNTINLHDTRIHQVGSSMVYSRALCGLIRRLEPDVISMHDRYSATWPSRLGTPKTFTLHSPDALGFYRDFSIKHTRTNASLFAVKKFLEASVMKRSDCVITLTKSMKDYLQEEEHIYNTKVIPNGVNPGEYCNKGDDNYVLFAGRLNKVKGIEHLIDAFAEISKHRDINLVLMGSGSEKASLEHHAIRKGILERIRFVPTVPRDALRECMSRCTAFVLPSLYETFGTVAVEAMASGKVVIASRIPGPMDIITDENDGFLFERGNFRDLAHHLELVLDDKDLRNSIGANARSTVEKRFAIDKVASDHLELWSSITCGQ